MRFKLMILIISTALRVNKILTGGCLHSNKITGVKPFFFNDFSLVMDNRGTPTPSHQCCALAKKSYISIQGPVKEQGRVADGNHLSSV